MPEHSSHSANQPTPMTVSLNSPTPPQLETRKQFSVCMDLPVLDISYKWNHSVRGLLVWLFFLSMMFSRITCVLAWSVQRSVTFMLPLRWTYSFPWVNNIPSYGYTTIFIHLYTHYSHFGYCEYTAMNFHVYDFVRTNVFLSLGYIHQVVLIPPKRWAVWQMVRSRLWSLTTWAQFLALAITSLGTSGW